MTISNELMSALRGFYEETFRPDFNRLQGEIHDTEGRLRAEFREGFGETEGRLRAEFREGFGETEGRLRAETHGAVVGLRFELQQTRDQLRGELREEIGSLRRDMDGHFDAVYQRFDRLETEYHMLVLAVRRLEEVRPPDRS